MICVGVVILQISMDVLKVEPDSCDDSEVTDVEVETVTIKEEKVIIKEEEFTVTDEEVTVKEEDPLLITLPLVETEHEVSLSVCRLRSHVLKVSRNAWLASFVCLSCTGSNSTWVSSSGRVPILSAGSFTCLVFNGTL
jgi:hypothetical protein